MLAKMTQKWQNQDRRPKRRKNSDSIKAAGQNAKNVSNCKASAKARQKRRKYQGRGLKRRKNGDSIKATNQNCGKNSIKSGENL